MWHRFKGGGGKNFLSHSRKRDPHLFSHLRTNISYFPACVRISFLYYVSYLKLGEILPCPEANIFHKTSDSSPPQHGDSKVLITKAIGGKINLCFSIPSFQNCRHKINVKLVPAVFSEKIDWEIGTSEQWIPTYIWLIVPLGSTITLLLVQHEPMSGQRSWGEEKKSSKNILITNPFLQKKTSWTNDQV